MDNTNENKGIYHLDRFKFNPNFRVEFLDDMGLAISNEIDRNSIPSQFEELFVRFKHLGFFEEAGTSCVLMSQVLRRILRYHGYNAWVREYVIYWVKEDKGYERILGHRDPHKQVPAGYIDAHVAVEVQGLVLDFSHVRILQDFGFSNPIAFIGSSESKFHYEYQDFGYHGKACWAPAKPPNPVVTHWKLNHKKQEMEMFHRYFQEFSFNK